MGYFEGAGKDVFGTNFWIRHTITGITNDFAVTSRTDHGVGDFSFLLAQAIISSVGYNRIAGSADAVSSHLIIRNTSRISTTSAAVEVGDDTGVNVDVHQRVYGSGQVA